MPLAPFAYECVLCGQCCSGTMKVFLNPMDLHTLGTHLGLNHTEELYRRKILLDDEGQQGIPWPRIRFRGISPGFCPFVENHWDEGTGLKALCTLQNRAKPLICRLAPVTRTLDFESERELFSLTPPVEGCPGFESPAIQDGETYLAPLRKELTLEERFFRILQRDLDERGRRAEELAEYFRFPLDRPMEDILKRWEEG